MNRAVLLESMGEMPGVPGCLSKWSEMLKLFSSSDRSRGSICDELRLRAMAETGSSSWLLEFVPSP
jgi:hypothetical protein